METARVEKNCDCAGNERHETCCSAAGYRNRLQKVRSDGRLPSVHLKRCALTEARVAFSSRNRSSGDLYPLRIRTVARLRPETFPLLRAILRGVSLMVTAVSVRFRPQPKSIVERW